MKVTDLSIKYRTTTAVLTALITLGGIGAYVTLPKESNPSFEIPIIVITTIYPGASPSDVENLITQVIEQEVQAINGIDEIRSTSVEGVSSIVVEFTPDVNVDEATQKVRDKVDLAKPDLPEDVEEPLINEIDFSEFPIMNINLAADYPLSQLKDVAEDLQDELEAIAAVLSVDLVGGLEREVQVDVDLATLQGYGLAFDDVVDTIRAENTNLPGGKIDVDRMNYLIRVDGQFERPVEIEDLVLKAPGGQPVYVRDVASVTFGFKDVESYARLKRIRDEDDAGDLFPIDDKNYRQVISLNVKKRSGENILQVSSEVEELIERYPFPNGTEILITGDQSEEVRNLVKDLENNILSGLVFVVAVLLFFLGVRTSILVGIAIPLSMFVSFIIFMALGETLNFVILFSLIIALGMLVDNAIVIVENIYRYREEGHDRWDSARLATSEVGGAVVASTATTVAAFIPMLFWPGIIGKFMGYMPRTLIVTLTASLFVALVINPVITGYFVKVEGVDEDAPAPRVIRWAGWLLVAAVAAMIGLTNPVMLAVLVGSTIAIMVLHRFVLKPVADGFVKKGLPRLISAYRSFLSLMLERDYTPPRAMLRNALGLVSFTVGFAGLVLGGLAAAAVGMPAAGVLLVPAGILFAVGVLAIIVHTLEVVALGGMTSVKLGALGLAGTALLLGIMYLSPRSLDLLTMAQLLTMPLLVVVVGFLGAAIFRNRSRLILTDNRAKLMNGVLGGLMSIVVMFVVAPTGVEFFPDTDPNQIKVVATGPIGQNVDTTNEVATIIQERLEELFVASPQTQENIKNQLVNVGIGGDSEFGGGSEAAEEGSVTMNLVDFEDRNEASTETLARVRDGLQGIPGIEIKIEKDSQGPPTGAPVNIEISGPSFADIVRIAEEVKALLRKGVQGGELAGLVDVRDNLDSGRPEMQVNIDRDRAAQFGLDTFMIANTVRTAIQGAEASTWRTGEKEYDITVRLKKEDRDSLDVLRDLTIVNEDVQIPLVAVADLKLASGFGSITRLDLERVITVEADGSPGVNTQELLGRVQSYLADYREGLPPGYGMKYTGENEEMDESFGFLTTALSVGIALITMILIAQFNSLLGPVIIMVAVGLSMIGVLLGLLLTRTPFGLFSFIGLISLAGIVVNNNIVLVDYTLQLRARGMSKLQAIVEAGATRLRPVLLTAMTTVLGLIPLTFGINIDFVGYIRSFDPNFQIGSANTQFWGPMGTAIISGLTFATFLTLVIVPVMYSLLDSAAVRLTSLRTRTEPRPAPSGDESASTA